MMNLSERIQTLRKKRGLSQEELAEKIGVSRQAVSKWESGQSVPDVEKIILLSDFFEVSTDYLLKGREVPEQNKQQNNAIIAKILYISSLTLVVIGLFCAFGGWYEKQTMDIVYGSMIIQAVGIAGYFVGKLLSAEKPPFYIVWLNCLGVAFMPISMITGMFCMMASPYPADLVHTLLFGIVFFAFAGCCFIILKRTEAKGKTN